MTRFHGRRILVTGGGSGIGLATANRLAAEGAEVAAVDRTFGPSLAAAVRREVADVRDAEQLARLAECPFDGLATFAGIEKPGRIEALGRADWDDVLAVNLMGTVNAVNAVLPGMVAAKRGAILLCSSQLSLAGGRECVAYAASKGAINSLCRSLALDLAADGVRVNAVAPGAIETPMMDRAFRGASAAEKAASMRRHALGRFGRADETAAAAAFALSDDASFVTGVVLPVDGGWTAA